MDGEQHSAGGLLDDLDTGTFDCGTAGPELGAPPEDTTWQDEEDAAMARLQKVAEDAEAAAAAAAAAAKAAKAKTKALEKVQMAKRTGPAKMRLIGSEWVVENFVGAWSETPIRDAG